MNAPPIVINTNNFDSQFCIFIDRIPLDQKNEIINIIKDVGKICKEDIKNNG